MSVASRGATAIRWVAKGVSYSCYMTTELLHRAACALSGEALPNYVEPVAISADADRDDGDIIDRVNGAALMAVLDRMFDRASFSEEDEAEIVALCESTLALTVGAAIGEDLTIAAKEVREVSERLDGLETLAFASAATACVLAEHVGLPDQARKCMLCAIGAGLCDAPPSCEQVAERVARTLN